MKTGHSVGLLLLTFGSPLMTFAKECSRFVTAEMRTNALANVAKYAWAAKEQASAIEAAERWMELSDEELWSLPTSQELPRTIHTNKTVGCPKCGKGILPYGDYPWRLDPWDRPWKLKCPNCAVVFPKNDFCAFYKTALDERGMFRRALGDRSLLVEVVDRDGMGGQCGGYGLYHSTRAVAPLAETLAACPDYTKYNLVKDYPKLKQCFLVLPRLNCLDAAFPPIGDSGSTGDWRRAGDVSTFVQGFKLYGDPEMAALAWRYAGRQAGAFRGSVFEDDPLALARRIVEAAKGQPLRLRCEHLGRYGQAVLQTENQANGRALWIHYGYGKGHSHHDCLTIGLYAKNIDMLPDLGYPEYTGGWPKRFAWTANTISHNTLLVGDRRSGYSPGGKIDLFAVQPPLRAIDVSSKTAYPGIDTYRRTVALVDVSEDDSYVLDVFRARGGTNHRLSYHGPAASVAVSGLELVKQEGGTFAGPDVAFATLPAGETGHHETDGFTYLYDVERSKPAADGCFTVDWQAEDKRGRIEKGRQPHLRVHALTPCDEVALASGDPPQNKPGNPRRLRYLIQSRLGPDMESQFVTVLEPYDTTPFIKQVRKLSVEHDARPSSVAAVAVEMADGATDILISCEERTHVRIEGGIEFYGQIGMIRLVKGQVMLMRMSNATLLAHGDVKLASERAAYEGKVVKIDASDPENHLVFLDPPLPPDGDWVGQTIHFENDLPLDTSYEIKAVTKDGISTGDITIIQGFKNPKDFAAGYSYLVNPGDGYVVPSHVSLQLLETDM